MIGVSLAVTTLPTPASGDVEVIASGVTLGNTVLMVIQAGLWNSADTVTGVNSAGSFQIQVRSTPAEPRDRRQRLLRAGGHRQHQRFLQHPG